MTILTNPKPIRLAPSQLTILAEKPIHSKVVTTINDQTVNVQVIRYRSCLKYLKSMRIKTKYQAHDPENKFNRGDLVTLQKCRPISKTKHHLAMPYVDPHGPRPDQNGDVVLNLPLQSAQ
ncbi:hypothetical protein LUZ60_016017 [Juncus effusus]|nr:hypothetical protein LUZ60_016017 [Juncus effusus]